LNDATFTFEMPLERWMEEVRAKGEKDDDGEWM